MQVNDVAAFIVANTCPVQPPLTPEITLQLSLPDDLLPMEALGTMYHNLHQDWARAAFWWEKAGDIDNINLAHVSINGVQRLVLVAKIMLDRDCQPIGVGRV